MNGKIQLALLGLIPAIGLIISNYYYSKVNDLKSELLTEATQDARMRAKTLAAGSGVKLGFPKAARQGSFSIRSAKSTNISSDDTYSITKKITAHCYS